MSGEQQTVVLSGSQSDAVIFDLDGVVTDTAAVHARAWKEMFDEFLRRRSQKDFAIDPEYYEQVDGKPRYAGVRDFLRSRGIQISFGSPDDPPEKETVCGLGNRKNEIFHRLLKEEGVEVFSSSVDLIRLLRKEGFKTAVVSSSKNCQAVLSAAGIEHLFGARVDGTDIASTGMRGKPEPDMFLEAADRLHAKPARAVVVEDAVAGVKAGKRGGFGLVVGVDRTGSAEAFREAGADRVVGDLSEITLASAEAPESALGAAEEIFKRCADSRVVVFLDYDGTLTPIVAHPDRAILSDQMRDVLGRLAAHCTVAVISGRDLPDVRQRVGLENLFYAGSHGFDISGPEGYQVASRRGTEYLEALDGAEKELRNRLDPVEGAWVERKKFSVAVHFRQVQESRVAEVREQVDAVGGNYPDLRTSSGKKIYELQPDIDWDKGRALLWLLKALDLDGPDVMPFYFGDDTTDEDGFRVLTDRGISIVVMEETGPTAAQYRLRDPDEVRQFLEQLIRFLQGAGE